MTLVLIDGPSTLPVTVEQAKANGRIDTDEEDSLVETYIRAALAYAERYCSKAFEPQTWEVVLDEFPGAEIEMPYGPIVSLTSVKYDTDAGEVTIDPANFVLDTTTPTGWLVPVSGYSWPTALDAINAVRVRFVVGSGTPRDVAQAVLLLAEHFYEDRAGGDNIPTAVTAILNLNRNMFV